MKIVFLDAATLGDDADYSRMRGLGELVLYDNSKPAEVGARIKDADVVITNKVPLDDSCLNNAHQLKLVCVAATGYNMLNIESLRKRNIAVVNVSGYSTQGVTQHTFAMLFYLMHSLRNYDDFVKSGSYSNNGMFTCLQWPFHELAGSRWGIIGLGTIGRQVAAVATVFGCEVVYYSASGNEYEVPYRRVELPELLETSDVVTIHAPLTEKTRGLIDYADLKLMKKSACIVNAGRGGIIDESGLARAIDESIIAGAATDVMTVEPLPVGHPLLTVKNNGRLLVTPHIAWASVESRRRLVEIVCDNISAFFRDEKLNRIV